MSALARLYLNFGHTITGSDIDQNNTLIQDLKKEGIIWIPPKKPIPPDTNLHIYTEAVSTKDPQRISALSLKIKSISYFEALGELSKKYQTIAVCGTHGKSTVTSMIGITLKKIQNEAIIIVGTLVKEFGNKNVWIPSKKPKYLIVEACEYRDNFLFLQPFGVVFLNCEWDHMDYFANFSAYKNSFLKLVNKIPKNGFLVANYEDKNVIKIAQKASCQIIPVKKKDHLKTKVPGKHNEMNAAMAKNCCLFLSKNYPETDIKNTLANFTGSWRRFDILMENKDFLIMDDYAHHPTEINATLQALEDYTTIKNIILIFQSHQYSRTLNLFNDFVESFKFFQKISNYQIFLTDIYEARDSENDKKQVNAKILVKKLQENNLKASYSGDYENTLQLVISCLKKLKKIKISANNLKLQNSEKFIIFTMGAGPVNIVAEKLVMKLENLDLY